MKTNKKRVERLEQQQSASELPPLDIVFVDTKEQVDHPERFKAVLDRKEIAESGMEIRHFHYERI